MTALRKIAPHTGLPVSYFDGMSEDLVRKIDEIVSDEFKDDDWVTVEAES